MTLPTVKSEVERFLKRIGAVSFVLRGDEAFVAREIENTASRLADIPEPCESCGRRSSTSDSEGTPLCKPCQKRLAKEQGAKVRKH